MAEILEREPPCQADAAAENPRTESLVERAARAEGRSAWNSRHASPENEDADSPPAPLADGYVRRSPVQPVRVSADYYRRRVRRIIGLIVLGAVLVVLVRILIGTGILAF